MRKVVWSLLVLVFILAYSSCVPNEKIMYYQNLEGNKAIQDEELISYELPEYRLQFNDIIDIQIQTVEQILENGITSKIQNEANNAVFGQIAQSGGDIYYMTGYTIDKHGYIRMPLLGEIQVNDKTLDEVRVIVEEALKKYVTSEIFVRVKLGGIRFSTLGEFRRPGKYVVLQDRLTIFEAIAQAGDMTTVAKRDEILLIRQYPDGTKLHRINLNDRQIIQTPFYFIQPNDQIYAEPLKAREIGTGENTAQTVALILSSVTAVALILNLILQN
ncbi:polysaccharide biosynthesis/export family protein [Aquiflexum gelatinilyticum]|uniref:Polysaccharide biosynthesis/export family protein n=1 Tax=Aquiflexum gelatinilyticum TaxID=2961943 RepID=A0A9X2SY77_9BACT|nr:polysaccharide biosynthesis/export family protein [Aquiflexum gelatinilyticum]MCR9014764.1 polysaccharide biosynthesis/export family protein [Aquiflexum gelatinilyticum]